MDPTPPLDDGATLWSEGERTGRPLLVLLHGYGSDERDLFALAPRMPPEYAIVSLRAPLTPPWPMSGHAWYPITGPDDRGSEPVTAAAARLIEWLDDHAQPSWVGLLGFSQGGAVAIQALRLDPGRFAFAVNLSGYATPGPLLGDTALAERRPPVFWGRGGRDDVIPEPLVAHSIQWLPAHASLSGRVYPALGHSVSEQELDDVGEFLRAQLEPPD